MIGDPHDSYAEALDAWQAEQDAFRVGYQVRSRTSWLPRIIVRVDDDGTRARLPIRDTEEEADGTAERWAQDEDA